MKRILKYIAVLATLCAGVAATSCINDKELVESIELTRCLTPLDLSVKIIDGDQVMFRWEAVKGADMYVLEVYSDKTMTEVVVSEEISSKDLPVTIKLEADSEYWFRVKAFDSTSKLEPSKWAVYQKSVKTYAVKPTVYLAVADRSATSITVSWDAEAAASEVDSVKWCVLGSEEQLSRALTSEEVEAATATVTGLEPFTNYVVSVYFKSANRGDLSIWTRPNTDGYTEITTVAALQQAAKDGGKFLLKMDGSPYVIGITDLASGIEIIGEESVDAKQPVIVGEFQVLNTVADGASFIFKSVELNGNKEEFGFPWQLKNGAAGQGQSFDKIQFISCKITGYSKGLHYEWGGKYNANELTWDGCTITEVNKANTQGGDGIDFRGASDIKALNVVNNTIYNGFRTFFRIDAATILGNVKINNNTFMNLSKDDSSTNNNGILGVKAKPASFEFKNNLILYMDGNAKLNGPAAANLNTGDLGISFSSNYFHAIAKPETFFNDKTSQAEALAGGGKILEVDPCYKAKAGIFNISDSDIINAGVGAPKWLMAYNKKPEDLTMTVIEGTHNWDFTNPTNFLGSIDEKMVRDQLFMGVVDNKLNVSDEGIMQFLVPTTVNRAKMPLDGYLAFLVDKPGSVYVKPVNINDQYANHIVIGKGDAEGKSISIKGGAAANTDNDAPAKIVIHDITEPSLIYVYATGQIGLEKLGWSYDCTPVNTALPTPQPEASPASVTAGEPKDIIVSWEPVQNADSYSVEFSGKTYVVEEETNYTIAENVVGMLDPGSYKVKVYANPGKDDIYNTMSEAGVATFAVQPAGGDAGSSEFVVSSVEELFTAIDAGKQAITLKYSDTPYEIGAYTVTTPLKLSGQTEGGKNTPIVASFTLSGEIGGSFALNNLDITNETASVVIEDKTAAPVVDTVAIVGCNIHGTKALYDNSGKAVSCVQVLRIRDNVVTDCSNGADFIDLRTGGHHTVSIINNTFANSCRTFIRTDKTHELNYLTVRNNTFYKVCTNSTNKDNNGVLHVRSKGLLDYKVLNNIFYSILIDETPGHANGYPKFRSASGIDPMTLANNYFYNCEDREDKADYSFWKNISKEAATACGGAILPADPFRDAENGDFTLINGVAMNANVGDPRWNPMAGSTPSSDIAVSNVADLLTAISAGKTTITLKAGTYNLNDETLGLKAAGKLEVSKPLNLVGEDGTILIGSFILLGKDVTKFTLSNMEIEGIGDYLVTLDAVTSASAGPVELKNLKVLKTGGLIYAAKNAGIKVTSLEVTGCFFDEVGSKDFIDFRDGSSLTAVKVVNNTFANGIRTFARIDASVADLGSVVVRNNTFYNNCYVDSKDNNGIFHVRCTALAEANFKVQNNIFAGMHRASETPSQANGYPKLVSTNTASKIPTFSKNYYYDIDAGESYSWWTVGRIDEAAATAGYGIVLTENPFKDAANSDFTLVNALALSERIGDIRWIKGNVPSAGEPFRVSSVEEMLTAINAGKSSVELAYGTYDFTSVAELADGKLTLNKSLALSGIAKEGKYPEIIGAFVLAAGEGATFSASKLTFNGNNSVADFILMNPNSDYSAITLRSCNVSAYKNRLFSQPDDKKSETTINSGKITFTDLYVSNMGTGGDCIDFRKGSASYLKITNSTFCNGIRTVVRMDAAVKCGSVLVKNNTFYNLCYADSKDNNGVLHVRAAASTIAERNIFANMHRASETPSQANGFPKLVSKASSAIAIPEFRDNLYFDLETVSPYSWWEYVTVEQGTANGGAVLTETPFAVDPADGKFTVKSEYKGYGALRW